MPRRWTEQEENEKREQLVELYVRQNKTIFEIGPMLNLAPGGVYGRLVRLGITIQSKHPGKRSHNAKILNVPASSGDLAEYCGIMLGDGHVGTHQFTITVNVKTDAPYVSYLQDLVETLFGDRPRITADARGVVVDLFVTSTYLMQELRGIGLYSTNKVRDQVSVPDWIFSKAEYQKRFIRGFFDTDGSIYLLKHFNAPQMLFKNCSFPLLDGTRQILLNLGYHPSKISGYSVYLTRRADIERYGLDIGFGNSKHLERAARFGVRSALSLIPTIPPGVVREWQPVYYGEQCIAVHLTPN
ncbi:MAG: LAGLIDADG family homing endonuclease [bacterium]